jgi:serine/threonine protein kinase/Tfp pilus assembly protein PilF
MATSPERWQRVQSLFYEALQLPADARSRFLKSRCDGDQQLQKELEELLQATDKPLEFLKQPVIDAAHQMVRDNTQPTLAAGARLAHYEIISLLGTGGMGEVYLAEDTRLRRKVALKMLKPELTSEERDLRRFEQEALAASALNHPNILTIYEFRQVDNLRFIVSEYIEGDTLREKIAHGPLPPNAVVEIAMQIASALSAAHASGIIHRDIKPDNVIVRKDGIVKVLDFGIAKLSQSRLEETIRRKALATTSDTSQPGMVVGTAKYMSPEQARGQAIDVRSDIFSLGSVVYELITCKSAFAGETATDVLAAILTADPSPPANFVPDVPYELERIISKAMRKDRETRYQAAADLQIDLQDYKKETEFQARLHVPARSRPARTGWNSRTPARATPTQLGPQPSLRQWFVVSGVLIAVLAIVYFVAEKTAGRLEKSQPRTLAILPFRNLNQDPQTDFLGFSLADEIITKLGYINALNVRPSSSIAKYRNQVIDPQKVAADLDVDTLLTGSFIREADELRITAQLIDVRSDKILWRDVIDVKYDRLLTVQDRVSEQIIKGLELNLTPAEAASIKSVKPINGEAYEYYLRGIDFYSLNQFAEAISALEKSTSIDPNYAPAWAHLGRAYTTHASLEFGGREDYIKAQAAYEKAIAINPSLLEPRIYMANLYTDTGRVEQAVPLLRSVLQDSPNNAEAHWELGYAYRFAGMLTESVAECERARQNNPQVKINSSALNAYLYLGEYEKFLESLPANDNVYILFYRGLGTLYLHKPQEAAADFDQAYDRNSSLLPADVGKALSYSIMHQPARGLELLQQTEAKVEDSGVSDAEGMYKLAEAFAILGDKASALHMLRHSVGGGFFCFPYFQNDPLLENIRGEAEFQSLLHEARSRHEQFQKTFFSSPSK